MSYEIPGKQITLPAASDLSGSQYRFVAVDSNGNGALAGAGAKALGVLQNKPTATQAAGIMLNGISKVIADGAITRGHFVNVGASGGAADSLTPQSQTFTIAITGGPTGGTFTLTFNGQTTAGIAYNAIASAVQTALVALSTVGAGGVTVTGSALPGGTLTAVFDAYGTLTAAAGGLTGGTSPAVVITETAAGPVNSAGVALESASGSGVIIAVALMGA